MEDMVNTLLPYYKGKKVLVTGHTGFKGTWLVRTLLLLGAEVIGYALEPQRNLSLFILTNTENDINSIVGDVRDGEHLQKVFVDYQPEIVFHLAAQPIVRESYQDPVTTYSTNVMGTVNLLEAVRKTPSVKSCVNITTDKVYRNKEWVWGYRENEELCGYDPYSNSKSCSELVTYSYKQAFFSSDDSPAISTARSGNVIGGGDFAKDRIIPDCVKAALSNEEIIVRNPHSIRPYQHVLECLSGYLLLAKLQAEDKTYAGSYNFGPNDDGCVTTGTLVQLFCDTWGNGATWRVQGDGGPHEANFLKLDCSKAKIALGWKPRWDIERAIRETVEWSKLALASLENGKSVDDQISSYFSSR
jgi:CDP-glucose 4,6-dehydratase